MRYWFLIFALLLSLPTEALVQQTGNYSTETKKGILLEGLESITDYCQLPAKVDYKWIGRFMVFPGEGEVIPYNCPIQIIGPYPENEVEIQLYEVTDSNSVMFIKYLPQFYIYYPMISYKIDDYGNLELIPASSLPKRSYRKMQDIRRLNPRLKQFRNFELKIYRINSRLQIDELLAQWRFSTTEKASTFTLSP